ncbi:uncharacterized protein AruCF_2980 [Achromobacter ruhlandii]|nr:uncharacterized protein AruCF_2980 [Achromobacter ruhlandii]
MLHEDSLRRGGWARQRRQQKTRLVGRVCLTDCGRALTHHSRNDGNNQRNADGAGSHGP